MKGLTRKEQIDTKDNLFADGKTIAGWARVSGFNKNTTSSLLSAPYGRQEILPAAARNIANALIEQRYLRRQS